MPAERDMAKRLDLEPSEPRFFELLYTRVCRPTFHVAHYGIGAALGGIAEQPDPALNLEQTGNKGAADALGLGLVTYAAHRSGRRDRSRSARGRCKQLATACRAPITLRFTVTLRTPRRQPITAARVPAKLPGRLVDVAVATPLHLFSGILLAIGWRGETRSIWPLTPAPG